MICDARVCPSPYILALFVGADSINGNCGGVENSFTDFYGTERPAPQSPATSTGDISGAVTLIFALVTRITAITTIALPARM